MNERTTGPARRRAAVAGTFSLLLAAGLAAVPLATGPAAAQAAAPAAGEAVDLDIPAGPLATALGRLALQTGLHVGYDAALVEGRATPGLSGRYTADQALARLLTGSGLRYRYSDARTVTLVADGASSAGEAGPIVLQSIVVDGGSGGVIAADGYVGRSSATGAKTDTPFVETPQSVSSVTESQIEDRNVQSLNSAIAYTPGVRVDAYGTDPRYDSFFVRGFNVTNTGVFRDNLRQPAAGYGIFLTEPYGLEGISILRGPSSALYGATGAGGLYNVITKRPSETPLHEVQAQVGEHDRYQGQFDLSGPVNEDGSLLYRLTGLARDSDTEVTGVPDDRAYIAPAVTWKPDEDTKLTLLSEYTRSKSGGNPAYYNDYYGHVSDYVSGDPAFTDLVHEQARVGYEAEHRLDDTFTLRQNLRYSTQDIDGKYVYIWRQDPADPTLLDRGTGYDKQSLDALVVDTQLETHLATGPLDHTVLTGFDFAWVDYDARAGGGEAAPLDTLDLNYGEFIATPAFTSRTEQSQYQKGLYVQDQIRWESFTLTGGARYDWVSTSTDDTDLTSGSVSSLEQDDTALSGRIGLTWESPIGLAPYVSYSTAFSPNVGWNETTNAPFKPTTSEQEEIGVKYPLPGRNVMLTAAVFNIDQEQGLFYEASHTGTVQVQRGRLRSRGFELEAVGSLDNGFSFAGSYSYTDLKILEGPADTIDKNVSSVPNHQAALWTHYLLPEDSALDGFGVGLGARYVGRSYGDDSNTLVNEGRVLFDASVSYDLRALDRDYAGLSLQVNATNLFDRQETTCTSGYCYKDPGRLVIGTIRYTW